MGAPVGARTYRGAMTRLTFPAYLDHIRSESARLEAVLAACDPEARVPACPDWSADDLLWHHSEVQWFWSEVVRRRPGGPPDDELRRGRADTHAGLVEQHAESSASLVDALSRADPAEAAWTWAPEQTVGFTYRRQAHESLIHRLDAEQAAGVASPLDPALAADGVAELLEVMYGGEAPGWGRIEPGVQHVRLDLTDTGHALWTQPCTFLGTHPESGKVYDGPHVLLVADPGTEPDAVVSGTAADLDAWLWKRRERDAVTVEGDPAAFAALLAAVGPPLD